MRLAQGLTAVLAGLLALAAPAAATPDFDTKDFGVRVTSAVIQAVDDASAYPVRVYYIRDSTAVYSATSADGLAFVEEAGVRLSTSTQPPLDVNISSITGLAMLPLDAGGWRMLYSIKSTTGAYRIYTATSADGLAWANSTGAVVDAGTDFAGHPALVELNSGDWRLWWVQNVVSGNQFANHAVYSAVSTNEGRNFGGGALAINATAGQVAAAKLTSGLVRVYFTSPVSAGISTHTVILSAKSRNVDGAVLDGESGVRLSTGAGLGEISNIFVMRSTDSYRWRLYYNFTPFPYSVATSTADVWSAVTDTPDIQGLTPTTVLRNQPAGGFTISGEIFDTVPAAALQKAGQADINIGAMVRVSDQEITGTFNTLNQALGHWNLLVTNPNTKAETLINALLIDFAGGDVRVTDNLLRPREGTRTSFAVTTYNDGNVTVKVYTTRGQMVATIMDQHLTAGTHTVTWDGKTAGGATAASGVYVVRVTGPKLDAVNKVVLIK